MTLTNDLHSTAKSVVLVIAYLHIKYQLYDLDTELDLYPVANGFHEAFAMGVASRQGTLTRPDSHAPSLFGTCLCSSC